MSGFSIELVEEGYRAVDPLARVRFAVTKAPDDMPITPVLAKDAKQSASSAPNGGAKVAASAPSPSSRSTDATTPNLPPAPSSSARDGLSKKGPPRPMLGATTIDEKKVQTMVFSSSGEASSAELTSGDPGDRAQPPPIGSAIPGLPPVKLLTSREQDPNDASPLTYREYAFAVAPGTSEESSVDVLRAQLRYVEAHIATAKMGKLVNLAVFDVEFSGKPPKPPVATLTWKDWKGEPVIAFPRRGGNSKPSRPPSKAPASLEGHLAQVVVPRAVEVPPFAQPSAVDQAEQARIAEQGRAEEAATRAQAAQQAAAPPEPTLTENTPPSQPPANAASGMAKTPSGRFLRGRVSGDELITSFFEAMHDLHFLRDALDGGQFCLALATEVLPSRAALIHFFDIEKREWVVACTRGKDTQRLLTLRAAESDELLRECARKRRALVVPNATTATSERYRQLNGARSLIAAPIMQAGRALGALEIINPLDGMPFTEDEGNAMTYIAEQYAEYLGSRGIVLDRDRIQNAAAAR